jgi:hypothetical protein
VLVLPMGKPRGLVISAPIELSAGRLVVRSSDLDPQELRFSLLFWDKLDWPTNNLIHVEAGPDAQFLEASGVLHRTHITLRGSGRMEDGFRSAHVHAFQLLDQQERGTWSLATGERSISFLDSELVVGRGALVGLHRAIPVPDKDVHLQDVLDFKERRRSELSALRYHLDAIYARVITVGDGPLALNSEAEALERAVSDYIKSTRGLRLKFRAASLKANVDLVRGVLASWAAYQVRWSAVDALAAGVVGASVTVEAGVGLARDRPPETPFRYVSAYHNELFPPS